MEGGLTFTMAGGPTRPPGYADAQGGAAGVAGSVPWRGNRGGEPGVRETERGPRLVQRLITSLALCLAADLALCLAAEAQALLPWTRTIPTTPVR